MIVKKKEIDKTYLSMNDWIRVHVKTQPTDDTIKQRDKTLKKEKKTPQDTHNPRDKGNFTTQLQTQISVQILCRLRAIVDWFYSASHFSTAWSRFRTLWAFASPPAFSHFLQLLPQNQPWITSSFSFDDKLERSLKLPSEWRCCWCCDCSCECWCDSWRWLRCWRLERWWWR